MESAFISPVAQDGRSWWGLETPIADGGRGGQRVSSTTIQTVPTRGLAGRTGSRQMPARRGNSARTGFLENRNFRLCERHVKGVGKICRHAVMDTYG